MITISVKTLDGLNRKFDVSGDSTIGQFKEFIANDVNIIPSRQRIIYQGRVLQDDKVLNALDLDGKTLHLVEKAPNQTDDLQRNTVLPRNTRDSVRHEISEQQVVIGNVVVPVSELNAAQISDSMNRVLARLGDIGRRATLIVGQIQNENSLEMTLILRDDSPTEIESPAYARLRHVQHVLSHMDHMLYHLEIDSELSSDDGTSSEILQDSTTSSATTPKNSATFTTANDDASERSTADAESSATDAETSAADLDGVEASTNSANSQNTIREATVSYYATVFDEFQRVQQRLQPFTQQYLHLLQHEEDYEQNPSNGQRSSHFFSNMQILLHNVSHVYHALSDLNIHFCRAPPRLVEPSVNRDSRTVIRAPEAQITMNFQRVNENDHRPNTTGGGTTGNSSGGQQFSTNQNQPPPPQQFSTNRNQPPQQVILVDPVQLPSGHGIGGVRLATPSGLAGFGHFALSGGQLTMSSGPIGVTSGQLSTPGGGGGQSSSTFGSSSSATATTVTQAAVDNGVQQRNSFLQNLLSGILSGPLGPRPQTDASSTTAVPNIHTSVTLSSGTLPGSTPVVFQTAGPQRVGVGIALTTSTPLTGGQRTYQHQQRGGPHGPRFGLGRGRGRGVRMTPGGQGTAPGQGQGIGVAGVRMAGSPFAPHNRSYINMAPQVLANSQQNLFSVDPFLPCSSRHFDPRNRTSMTSSSSGARDGAPTGSHDRTCEHNESRTRENAGGGAGGTNESQAVDLNEFESTMEQLLRSVLGSMRIHRVVPASTFTVEAVSVEAMSPPTSQPEPQQHPLFNAAAPAQVVIGSISTDQITPSNVGQGQAQNNGGQGQSLGQGFTAVRPNPPNNVESAPAPTSNDSSATYLQRANERGGPSASQTVPSANAVPAAAESHEDFAWKENVPAEWVSVIEDDIEKQKSMETQRPFSDAYLNGMPMKRRKVICDTKPNLNTDSESTVRQLLQSSVSDSAARTSRDQSPDEAVTSSTTIDARTGRTFEAALKEKIRQRAECDPDFDEQRFANVKKMLEK